MWGAFGLCSVDAVESSTVEALSEGGQRRRLLSSVYTVSGPCVGLGCCEDDGRQSLLPVSQYGLTLINPLSPVWSGHSWIVIISLRSGDDVKQGVGQSGRLSF
ncbi:Uncharacterized protein DAT39_011047 [Clarias magur]|uniref:Uncharacterized protein n=1 Tax=Clarias magur TaxID=1594786 RepID=A0A8J4X0K2_CLAMG|nr:Uncharacterized protein DAT39_011047 [Clarias magur]